MRTTWLYTILRDVYNYSVNHNVGELLLTKDTCIRNEKNTTLLKVRNYSVNENVGGSLLFNDIMRITWKIRPGVMYKMSRPITMLVNY